MVDDEASALDSSTHTAHTSIVRPNAAVWPLEKAIKSWVFGGPFDIRSSADVIPFLAQSALESVLISDEQFRAMWGAFRRLGMQSRQMYVDFDRDFGPIFTERTGRGHLASPLVPGDQETVSGLRDQLNRLNVESDVVTNASEIQSYVGKLEVRHPQLMVRYPEDLVLDLGKFKRGILQSVDQRGCALVRDTVTALERNSRGGVTTVLTSTGRRIKTGLVLYAGGWRAKPFLKKNLGVNLNSHLNVAAGVRFLLPGHLVDRSIVCGPMFLAPGFDSLGNPITDIGQMFLVNFTSPYPSRRHLKQALERFHTYFNYDGDISRVWNCVGRPISTTGMPFIEKVAPNMVIASGTGMFGVSVGPGVAQRALELLFYNKLHDDHLQFARKSAWEVIETFVKHKYCPAGKTGSEAGETAKSRTPRIIQVGRRGAMTAVLAKSFAQKFDFAVYSARDLQGLVQDVERNPGSVVLVASHGSLAKLPAHYDTQYIHADWTIDTILKSSIARPAAIVLISGGVPKPKIEETASLATQKGVRFLYLPGLATSMETVSNASRAVMAGIEFPTKIVIVDTFHSGKKEVPSAGTHGLLRQVARRYGSERLMILAGLGYSAEELQKSYPASIVQVGVAGEKVEQLTQQMPTRIPVFVQSRRLDVPYRYQHIFAIHAEGSRITIEQAVHDRAQLVPAVQAVLGEIPRLPPGFSCASLSGVLGAMTFRPGSSTVDAFMGIVQTLERNRVVTRLSVPPKSLSPQLSELVKALHKSRIRFETDASLSNLIQVEAKINGQSFLAGFGC